MKMTGLIILAFIGIASAFKLDPPPPVYTAPTVAPPGTIYTAPEPAGGRVADLVRNLQVNGIVTFDQHACVFRYGEVQIRGRDLQVGEDGIFEIEESFATTLTGERVNVEDGLVHVHVYHPRNRAAISEALAQVSRSLGQSKDMTIEDFIQLVGTPLSPQLGVIAITAGVISINGVYRNINAGVLVVVVPEPLVRPRPGPGGVPPPSAGYLPGLEPIIPITVVVTETAAHETYTVYQPVVFSKTTTSDLYETITRPVYKSAEITITDFVKKTVTVPEQQVIRSPLVGSVIVNTNTIPTRVIMTVTDTTTNYFVQTGLNTVSVTLQHFSSMFTYRTITTNIPVTSTVTQPITLTTIETAYTTNTLVTTMYVTTTVVITFNPPEPTTRPPTTTPPIFYGAPTTPLYGN